MFVTPSAFLTTFFISAEGSTCRKTATSEGASEAICCSLCLRSVSSRCIILPWGRARATYALVPQGLAEKTVVAPGSSQAQPGALMSPAQFLPLLPKGVGSKLSSLLG